MVQGLAQQSGGKFVLSSVPGTGTRAEIWLRVADTAVLQKEGDVPRREALPAHPTERLRIRSVDDDPLVLENTAAMLGELGHEVLTTNGGAQALKILQTEKIDLLITDYAMPGMTGEELSISVLTNHPQIPILMISGYADLPEGVAVSVPKLGKPFREDQLASATAEARSAALNRAA